MSLLGGMRISHGAEPLKDKMHRAVKGLLAYLVLFHRVYAREVLLGLFWGITVKFGHASV
jgi:DNA-binding SARP family transcriptional activator